MINPYQEISMDKLILTKIRSAIGISLSKEQLRDAQLSSNLDFVTEALQIQLRWTTLGRITTTKYPSTWWQFFKETYFPKWLLEKFPVNYTFINAYQLFPDLPFPVDSRIEYNLQGFGELR